ncbi:MAG TPA: OmpA family protein [Pseudolabrys sp.]|nr:OmpA family protein [Pseudolabrys sp.]
MKSEKALLGWIAVCATCAAAVAIAVPSYGYLVVYPKVTKSIDARFVAIDGKIDKLSDQSARRQRIAETTGASDALSQIKSVILPAIGSLGTKIEKANATISADTQKASSAEAIKSNLASLDAKVEKITAAVAQIENAGVRASTIEELKSQIGAIALSQAALSKTVASLSGQIKQASVQPSAGSTGEDLAVVYVTSPNVPPPGSIPVMTVNYEKVGSLDDNGQTTAIVDRLKQVLKDRKNCTIGVEGYADTLGGDARNLQISKKRAEEVAAKLKLAFAGQDITISNAGWGERRLKVWTNDNTGQRANRRVDIEVSCKD